MQVLILEDSPHDAELMVNVLERGGFGVQFEVVESADFFRECLEKSDFDVILADFELRGWTALDALEILKRSGKDIPLIVLTGALGETAAVECIKQGAADFIAKDRLARLPKAVQSALEDKRLRTENQRALEAISRLATIVESSDDAIIGTTLEGVITSWNGGAERLYGSAAAEVLGQPVSILVPPDRSEELAQILARLRRGERVELFESVRVRKDGNLVDVSLSMFPLTGLRGDVIGAASIARDITECKRNEEDLALFKHSIDVHYDGAYWADTDNRFIYFNNAGCRALGCEREELIGKTILDISPEASPEGLKHIWESLRNQGFFSKESVHRRKDGSEFPVELLITYVQFAGKEFACGFARDITERKRAEARVRESEEKFRKAFMTGAGAFYISTLNEGVLLEVNDCFQEIYGYGREEFIGKTSLQVGLWADPADRVRMASEVKSKGYVRSMETRGRRKGGEIFPLLVSANLLRESGEQFILGVIQDITERKRAEEALRQSEAKLKEALLAAQMGVWEWTLATDTVTWDENLYRIAGRDPKLPAPSFQEHPQIYAPESWERLKAAVENALATGTPYELDLDLVRPDGSKRWVIGRGEPLRDASGRITQLRGTVQDITERKQAEDALRESESRLKEALLAAQLGVWEWTAETDTVTWDENVCRIAGRDPKLPAPSFQELVQMFVPESWERHQAAVENALATGTPYELDLEMVFADGSKRWVVRRGEPLRDASGRIKGLRGTVQDITERKRVEDELRSSEIRYRSLFEDVS